MSTPLSFKQINEKISSFSRLTAIGHSEIKFKRRKLLFLCTCGNTKLLEVKEVLKGKVKSCGCLRLKLTINQINEKIKDTSRLTALEIVSPKFDSHGWEIRMCRCICSCGKEKTTRVTSLMYGSTKSCGCLEVDTKTKYSENNPHIYDTWKHMMQRCYDPKNRSYKSYGGKGVIVCDEWKNYQTFLDWCLLNGAKKGLELDKDIKGNGKLYGPETCVFVTSKENMMYTTRALKIEYNGNIINFRVFCHNLGIDGMDYRTIYSRVRFKKWDIEKAISTPIKRITQKP